MPGHSPNRATPPPHAPELPLRSAAMPYLVLWFTDEAGALHIRPPETPPPEGSVLLGWSALTDGELRVAWVRSDARATRRVRVAT